MKDDIKVYKIVSRDGEYTDYNGNKEFYNAGDKILTYKSANDYDFGEFYDTEYILNEYSSPKYVVYLNGEYYKKD